MQAALTGLLRRSSKILLIAGISSSGHPRANLAAEVELPADALAKLEHRRKEVAHR